MTEVEGSPRKVYVEPTNACNLACATCVRHSWDEPEGFMDWATFEAVVDGLEPGGTVAFMGLGEPLLHPRFLEMVRARQGARTARRGDDQRPPPRRGDGGRAPRTPASTSSWSASTAPMPRPSAGCAQAPRSTG